MPILEHQCNFCNYQNRIRVEYVDPTLYTNPEDATVKRAHWCNWCGSLIGIVYKFLNKKTVEIVNTFKPTPKGVPPLRDITSKELYDEYGDSDQIEEEFAPKISSLIDYGLDDDDI